MILAWPHSQALSSKPGNEATSIPGFSPFSSVIDNGLCGSGCISSGTTWPPPHTTHKPSQHADQSVISGLYPFWVQHNSIKQVYTHVTIQCSLSIYMLYAKKKGKWAGLYGYCLNARGFTHILITLDAISNRVLIRLHEPKHIVLQLLDNIHFENTKCVS